MFSNIVKILNSPLQMCMCVDWSIGTTATIMKDILHKSEKMVIGITGISNVL